MSFKALLGLRRIVDTTSTSVKLEDLGSSGPGAAKNRSLRKALTYRHQSLACDILAFAQAA